MPFRLLNWKDASEVYTENAQAGDPIPQMNFTPARGSSETKVASCPATFKVENGMFDVGLSDTEECRAELKSLQKVGPNQRKYANKHIHFERRE
jgi:hypothetical protein